MATTGQVVAPRERGRFAALISASFHPFITLPLAAVAGTRLVARTRRVAGPIVPLGVLRERIVTTSSLVTGLSLDEPSLPAMAATTAID